MAPSDTANSFTPTQILLSLYPTVQLPFLTEHPEMTLFLKTTRSQYGSPFNVENDYVVLHDGQVIGRIILPPPAQGCPWFWTITAREKPPSIHNRGYSVTREQAMKDFKTQWLTEIQR